MQAGIYFGEMALMVDIPRTTTVDCACDSLLAALDKDAFTTFIKVQTTYAATTSHYVIEE
jgi:CRP-like cAMP-binding protein